jgi:hypothetical protein
LPPKNPLPTKSSDRDRVNPLTGADLVAKPKPFWKRMLPKKPTYSSDLPKMSTHPSASSANSRDGSQQQRRISMKKGASTKSSAPVRSSASVRSSSSPTLSQKSIQQGSSPPVQISYSKSPRQLRQSPQGIIIQASREPSDLSLSDMVPGGPDASSLKPYRQQMRDSSGEHAARQLYARSLVSGSSSGDVPCAAGEETGQFAGKMSHAMVGGSSSVCSAPQRRSKEDEDEVPFLF